jgi:hypothetical protein
MIVKETKEPIFSITIPKNGNYNSLKRMAQEYGQICEVYLDLGEEKVGIWNIRNI